MKETCGSRYRKWYIAGVACPEGRYGKRLVRLMNILHAPFHRWVLRTGGFQEKMSLLDIGAGGGGFASKLQRFYPFADIACCDVSPLSVEYIKGKVEGDVFLSSADKIRSGPESYDFVTALDTVYYWEDLSASFSEALRVLKPGGVFLLGLEMTDQAMSQDWALASPSIWIRSVPELTDALVKAGFTEVKAVKGRGTWTLLRALKKC